MHPLSRLAMLLAAFIFSAWACLGGGAAMHAAELHIGAAAISITPEQPVALSGQMHTRISQRVDSPVMASALVLESRDGSRSLDQAIMVACDLVAIREGQIEEVREKIKQRLPDVDPHKIFLERDAHPHRAGNDRRTIRSALLGHHAARSLFAIPDRARRRGDRASLAGTPAGKRRLGTGPCRRRAESARGLP